MFYMENNETFSYDTTSNLHNSRIRKKKTNFLTILVLVLISFILIISNLLASLLRKKTVKDIVLMIFCVTIFVSAFYMISSSSVTEDEPQILSVSETDISVMKEEELLSMLSPLDEETWVALTNSEKLEIFSEIAKFEAFELGCSLESFSLIESDLDERVIGEYNMGNGGITLDSDYLEQWPFYAMLDVLLHETYHLYQHQATMFLNEIELSERGSLYSNLELFDSVKEFRANQINYISYKDDKEAYSLQPLEKSANYYASQRLTEYYYVKLSFTDDNELQKTVVDKSTLN